MTYIGGVRLRAAMLAGGIAGIGAGLTFATLHAIVIVPIWDRMTTGLVFAAVAGAALLRVVGLHAGAGEYVRVVAALGLAVLAGGLLGRVKRGTKRAMAAGAAATLLLVITMAGPVPIANSPRAFGIFLSVLPSAIVAGAVIGFAVGVARRGAGVGHPAS